MQSMFHTFMEAVTSGQRQSQQEGLGAFPHTHQPGRSQVSVSHSRSSSKDQRVPIDPNMSQRRSVMLAKEGQSESGSEEEFQDSRDRLVPENQAEPIPTPQPTLNPLEVDAPLTMAMGGLIPSEEVETNQEAISPKDLIKDAMFYQDMHSITKMPMRSCLHSRQSFRLQDKFKAQSSLMEEASATIHAAETEAKQHHQELLRIRHDHQEGGGFCGE